MASKVFTLSTKLRSKLYVLTEFDADIRRLYCFASILSIELVPPVLAEDYCNTANLSSKIRQNRLIDSVEQVSKGNVE